MKTIHSSKRSHYLTTVSVFLILAALIMGMVGCGGTQPTATKVRDWYDLDAIRDELAGDYLLMNDLDSTTAGYEELASIAANGGKGWKPIGTSYNPFTGILDGQGYEIRDLSINRPQENYVGLFGYSSEGGAIKDIGATNLDVIGYHYVGGLVGCNYGTVTDSYSIGSVTGEKDFGGLVGYDVGNTVSNSYYDHDESLINGENMITTGALYTQNFEEWLANNKFLDVSERLSEQDGYYLIQSVSDFKELLAFGQNASLKFRLTNDLDLGDDPNFYIPYMAAEFDGDGHTISNLSLHHSEVAMLGLFGYVIASGKITGLGVENANVAGDRVVGGLIGYNLGTVSNSYSTGNVTGYVGAGGLVGRNDGTVRDSSFTGSVTGDRAIGGLVGFNAAETAIGSSGADAVWGTVSNSYATGNVTGKGAFRIGGLVGWNKATVSSCHFGGNVTGWIVVGGLVGDNEGTGIVSNSYSTASVIGFQAVGGLVGQNPFGGTLSNTYSVGNVIGFQGVGGLVGVNDEGSAVTNSFWDVETSGQGTSDGGIGKNTTEMQDITTFGGAAWDIIGVTNPSERNTDYIWNMVDHDTYPFLNWQSNVPVYHEAPGKSQLYITSADGGEVTEPGMGTFGYDKGTVVNLVAEANEGCHFVSWTGDVSTIANVDAATTTITMNDNYLICATFEGLEIWDWYDLDAIRDNLNGYYILMNDLDSATAGYEEVASTTANGGKGWEPIGTPYNPFTGILEGQGYEIRDLLVNRPTGDDDGRVGLFQWVGVDGCIKNVGLMDVTMTGWDYVGGLVSYNEGTVINSCSTGSVNGHAVVGGLVGQNENSGFLRESYSTATVNGDDFCVGGLAGSTVDGMVFNCYSTGKVTGLHGVGGLLGQNLGSVLDSSYATGQVIGEEHVGGLVGQSSWELVRRSFWDTETSGQSTSAGGTGRTTAEMRDITTFSEATWRIVAVADPSIRNPVYTWNIVDGETYPFLSWESAS